MSEDWWDINGAEEEWDKIEIQRAREWWDHQCPDWVKGKYSIWVILAMYAKWHEEQ